MKRFHFISFIVGIILTLVSFKLLLAGKVQWYFIGMPALWLIFDYFHFLKGGKTCLSLLFQNFKVFFQLYFIYLMLAFSLEMIGRHLLGWWIYPNIHTFKTEIFLFAVYPFVFMWFREMYEWLKMSFRSKLFSLLGATALAVFLCEWPNTLLVHWLYQLPFIPHNIGNLNLLMLILWPTLIFFPVYVFDTFVASRV